ncbi:A disintegrin and metalloproteinase with thrombospondin motifs 9 isoform X2 [Aethina tumida]|uniref:A disintegrin and metalloproteinase with thrombospondin motifs 9 isoform X2 n=1 Tax=Aethina tumida TaxID=116153 RepID=UPI0021474C8E|nr:A disintegrin and metalloproteinase with thrombospondin motifs 9 isoform X2 [Aethina tumida]
MAMKCVSTLSCVAITLLVALVVFVWIQFGQIPIQSKLEKVRNATRANVTVSGRKNFFDVNRFYPDPVEDTEWVEPLKISPPPLNSHDRIFEEMHYSNNNLTAGNNDVPTSKHHSGHFRHKTADVWDPYPRYEIKAFGRKMILELAHDSGFVTPDLHIVTHVHENYTERERHDPKLTGCFYKGTVRGDPDSNVAVSLCHGMTGYIKTSEDAYHIEPEQFNNNTISTILHKITRVHLAPQPSNDVIDSFSEEIDSIPDDQDFHGEIVEDEFQPPQHSIRRRDLRFDDLDTQQDFKPLDFMNEHVENPFHLNDYGDYTRNSRQADYWPPREVKRSHNYFVEVMLVVDKSMIDYHKTEENLNHYIMTLMNHVSLLFKHSSIGNSISVSLVNILHLKHKTFEYEQSAKILSKFCQWQSQSTNHKNHDVALLLTRSTICTNTSEYCRFLGIAQVASMCGSESCAVVIDRGLATSYTIAHELGHVLSMPHDNDTRCNQFNRGQRVMNIMNNIMKNDTKPWMWSNCSKHYLTEFLDTPRAKCLLNSPTNEMKGIGDDSFKLPGELFDVNTQCQLEYGDEMRVCSYMTTCRNLWCTPEKKDGEKEGCISMLLPLAEGTRCEYNKWCYQGECRSENRSILVPIDGGWGEWGKWGPCSRSCGGGIMKQTRKCDNPTPSNGGNFCMGRREQIRSCNVQNCDAKEPDFRALQCARFNGDPKNIPNLTNDVEWLPKYGLEKPDDRCKLYCRPKNSNAFYALKEKVEDGTKCGLTSFDICVNGICRAAGCDNKLDSKMKLDDCGVCGGDNSKCHKIVGIYNRSSPGYSRVIKIPKGSSNILIEQYSESPHTHDLNYLVLMDIESGEYILNGHQVVMRDTQDITFGGLFIKYSGSDVPVERITTSKHFKLQRPLMVEVLSVGNITAANISYSYYIDTDNAPRHGWNLNERHWTPCDSICTGTQELRPSCVDLSTGMVVDDSNCVDMDRASMTQTRTCNLHCQLTWNVVSRGACSSDCGPGYREVTYNCMKVDVTKEAYEAYTSEAVNSHTEIVDERWCSNVLSKPTLMETCTGLCHSTRWKYEQWTQCSKTCGGGMQHRTAKCVDSNEREIDEANCREPKITEKTCNTGRCPYWSPRDWTPCSVSCGRGFRTRTFFCLIDNRVYPTSACDAKAMPDIREECNQRPCDIGWITTPWSECSTTCGDGIMRRYVYCRRDRDHVDDEYCRDILKPNSTAPCFSECPISNYDYGENMIDDNSIYPYAWKTSSWTECSKSCGGGKKRRQVVCEDERGVRVLKENCNPHERPLDTIDCNNFPCPNWVYGDWGVCNSDCVQMRQVSCEDHTGNFMKDHSCDEKKKPAVIQRCTQCRHRPVVKENRRITNPVYVWKVGKWKQCSKSCGRGMKTRNVTCHRILPGGVVNPEPLEQRMIRDSSDFCNLYNKPVAMAECNLGRCEDRFYWTTGPWTECPNRCDVNSRQTRRLYCVRRSNNRKVRRKFCAKEFRPKKNRKCPRKPCLYRNCKEIQLYKKARVNDDYTVRIGNKLASIYCYKMDTSEPEEFITLQPDTKNYAEFYDKRLIDLSTCPYNRERRDNCHCDVIDRDRHGLSNFWKVRLNITSLKIINTDFTFSNVIKGTNIPYGTSGDCYSSLRDCPQGRFSIDLSGTSFRLAPEVQWIKSGNHNATARIRPNRHRTVFEGQCGGYCGRCEPDPRFGLQLEVT